MFLSRSGKKIVVVALLSTCALAFANWAQASTLSQADQKILMEMAQVNLAEIATAKLAKANGGNDTVKNFAQVMIDDHTKALGEVRKLAKSKGLNLPNAPDSAHQATLNQLQGLKGADFDKAYLAQAGVHDHTQVADMLKDDATRASDPELKALAQNMLPTVEQHLSSAHQLQDMEAKGMPPISVAK